MKGRRTARGTLGPERAARDKEADAAINKAVHKQTETKKDRIRPDDPANGDGRGSLHVLFEAQ